MGIKREFYGETKTGAPVYVYHLTGPSNSENGIEVCVLNYGCIIKNVFVTDKNGLRRDVTLGFDDINEYFNNDCFIGATVGPCANRTANAEYKIDGKSFHMAVNDGPNNLHTDKDNGFHKRIWDAEENDNAVTFKLHSEDGDLGFAGNRDFSVTFSVSDDDALTIRYHATSDARTLINMTNHAYYNLNGHASGSIESHLLKLNSSHYTPVAEGSIPTGEIANVVGTPFDFIEVKEIGRDIREDNEQLHLTGGYDHNFCVDGFDGTRRTFATAKGTDSGITMTCSTTLPGFQFYAGNFVKSAEGKGKDGATYKSRDGFCLETQFYPDSVNEPEFPDPIFGPEREYNATTVYKFKA